MEKETTNILDVKKEETEALLKQKEFNMPLIQVKELPSEFKGYPKGTIISYAPLTLGELEALNSDDIEPTRAVALLLDAIHCNTLPSEKLYYWDIMYIGIQRKLQAFGNTKGTLFARCPKCGNIVSKQFDYTEIEFKQISAPDLPMKIDICGKPLEFGELTMMDFLQVEVEQGELGVYARMIKNLEFEEAYNLVSNAYGIDIKKLRFVDKQLNYGMKPFFVNCTNTVKNPKTGKNEICNEQVALEVRSPFEVVFPDDVLEGNNDFEVQYG